MNYSCPVCGYDRLVKPAADHNICPCCGTEFGYDDIAHSVEELRQRWTSLGLTWFSSYSPPPAGWNPAEQVARAGNVIVANQNPTLIFTSIGQNVSANSQYSQAAITIINLPMAFVHERLDRQESGTGASSIDAVG